MRVTQKIIGNDPMLKELIKTVKSVAPTMAHVLITGETGTGKELIAQAVQENSILANKLLVTLNCASLPEKLAESELFGYTKGAFTGADFDKIGIIEAANGGTLFLDEINSLPLGIQAKLLRFLENGEYLPVGAVKSKTANVRIIAASNNDLEQQVSAGLFRQDLFYRLSVVPLQLPALRERKKDIELLLNYYFAFFAKKHQVRTAKISPQALCVLNEYAWPGNIRELRNLCENMTLQCLRRPVEPSDLPLLIEKSHIIQQADGFILPEQGLVWQDLESDLIQQAMVKCQGKYGKAANLLGITRDSLYYKFKKLQGSLTIKKKTETVVVGARASLSIH